MQGEAQRAVGGGEARVQNAPIRSKGRQRRRQGSGCVGQQGQEGGQGQARAGGAHQLVRRRRSGACHNKRNSRSTQGQPGGRVGGGEGGESGSPSTEGMCVRQAEARVGWCSAWKVGAVRGAGCGALAAAAWAAAAIQQEGGGSSRYATACERHGSSRAAAYSEAAAAGALEHATRQPLALGAGEPSGAPPAAGTEAK